MPISQINSNSLASGVPARSNLPTGSVLQVVSSSQTSTQAISGSSTWTDLTNLSVSITPTSSTSKILVMGSVNVDGRNNVWFRFVRNSTAIGIGDASGSVSRVTMGNGFIGNWSGNANQTMQYANQFLDSPATTSATTYKIQAYVDNGSGSGSMYINYANAEVNGPYAGRSISTITVMEISA